MTLLQCPAMDVILASGSPTRQEIFQKLGFQFSVVIPDCDETLLPNEKMEKGVCRLAAAKAENVYKKIEQEKDVLVCAFDSLVAVGGKTFSKPQTKKEAFAMFQSYRGNRVAGFTGISLVGNQGGKKFHVTQVEKSWVHFRADTTNCQIRDFLAFNDWKGKAGGLTVEGIGAFLIEKIEGDFPNILGVPILKMGEMIREIYGKNPVKILTPAKKRVQQRG